MKTSASTLSCAEKQSYITRVIRTEEENFAKTIDGGMKIFTEMLAEPQGKAARATFSGADAFKLYDTYGFPIDLTNEMVAEEGMQRRRGRLPAAHAGAEGARP